VDGIVDEREENEESLVLHIIWRHALLARDPLVYGFVSQRAALRVRKEQKEDGRTNFSISRKKSGMRTAIPGKGMEKSCVH